MRRINALSAYRVDLNGEWSYAFLENEDDLAFSCREAVEAEGGVFRSCTVPGNFELDLYKSGLEKDPFFGMNPVDYQKYEYCDIFYTRKFDVKLPESFGECLLVFEGLDCYADVYLNGELIAQCDNALVPAEICVCDFVREGENEVFIHLHSNLLEARKYATGTTDNALATNFESLYVRRAPHSYGWDIMPKFICGGIYRNVFIEFYPKCYIREAYLINEDFNSKKANLTLRFDLELGRRKLCDFNIGIELSLDGRTYFASKVPSHTAGALKFSIDEPQLWWPLGSGEQPLYDTKVTLYENGVEVDSLCFMHGIRSIDLERTSYTDEKGSGEFVFRVNGEKIYIKGSNWVPADAFHSRDVERIPQMVALAKELNCNMLRCWGGNVYENDLFYELCDEYGILVWQDFSMACGHYPQTPDFAERLELEAIDVVKRLREHCCVALWSGDNECDQDWNFRNRTLRPWHNMLTRKVLPEVVLRHDATRPFMPSSPYVDEEAYKRGVDTVPEDHIWGTRDYYKSPQYRTKKCHFVSEMGYHGSVSVNSMKKFISPDKLWPFTDNEEWLLHSTNGVPGVSEYTYRVELMRKQIKELFKEAPDNLEEYVMASQFIEAEADKFFAEDYRSHMWRRTGMLWWNVIDGWPQFSDAVVDYYFEKKIAFYYLKQSQQDVCLIMREPNMWNSELTAVNGLRTDKHLTYRVWDIETGKVYAAGQADVPASSATVIEPIPFVTGEQHFLVLEFEVDGKKCYNHYLAGYPGFDFREYRAWYRKYAALIGAPEEL